MPDKKFDLGDYVEVKDRIAILYERFPQARIETAYDLTSEPDGKPKVIVRAEVYRKPEDAAPAGQGTSWMYLPGKTSYTLGSEVENAETSAVGRAIGMLGILIDKSFATSNEVESKSDSGPGAVVPPAAPVTTHDGSLIGIAEVGKVGSGADFELRQSPEGPVTAFRLKQGRTGIKVVAHGAYAVAVASQRPEGQQVKVWGSIRDESFAKGGKDITYQVVDLERIEGDGFAYPADWAPEEAPSEPLFPPLDEDERAAVAGSLQ